MTENNLKVALKPFFDKLDIDEMNFNYDEKTNSYISEYGFYLEEDDPQEYYMVIKLYNNIGTVTVGYSNGIKFFELDTLGQIIYENNKWESLI